MKYWKDEVKYIGSSWFGAVSQISELELEELAEWCSLSCLDIGIFLISVESYILIKG